MTNQTKQYLFFAVVLVGMWLFMYLDEDIYKTVLLALGGWQIGTWASEYSRKRWPREGIDT